MLENILDSIDRSIETAHRRFAEKWQEWTGTSSYYLKAIVAGASNGFYLASVLLPEAPLFLKLISMPVIGINAIDAIRNVIAPKSTTQSSSLKNLDRLSTAAYLILPVATISDLVVHNYAMALSAAGAQMLFSRLYLSRSKLPPPGEGKLHKALQAVKSTFSYSAKAPAPAQT